MAKATKHRSAKTKSNRGPKGKPGTKTRPRLKAKKVSRKVRSAAHVVRGRRPEKRAVKRAIIPERDPHAIKVYEGALKHFHQEEFAKARDLFLKVIEQFPKETEIVERSRIHLTICQRYLSKGNLGPKTAEDYYNLAVAHLNRRDFEQAEAAFEKGLSMEPKGDYIFYGLASLEALRGKVDLALKHLQRAIQLNPINRSNASRDADFEALSRLPEFQELVRMPSSAE